eukprot:c22102_g1_i1 orf=430-1323(-)
MPTTSNSHYTPFRRNLSGTYSSLSKIGQWGFFRRQKSDSRTSLQNVALDGGLWSQQRPGHQIGGMDWSMQAFSQLVASSQREGFGLSNNMDVNNASENADEGASLSLERIRVPSLQNSHRCSPDLQGDAQICGICSRWLPHRSPWSSQRMLVGNIDLPVVGVLVCGHVFHADCLEKAVPEMLRHDPPCPQCDQYKDASGKANSSESAKALNEPRKGKFSKIGPQLWRRSFPSAKSASALESDKRKGVSMSGDGGFFQRSFSRKQFSFQSKPNKDLSSQSWSSKKVNSPAQVSPENQL